MTTPRERPVSDLHPTAEGFDRAAREYDRGRPGYPAAAVDLLCDRLDVRPQRRILDVGAGTGKLTRELVERGADVVAVEPTAGMRRELRATLPGVEVLAGTAETLPLPDASVDAITAAQAFHWFDVDRALPELHRVLRPDGTLAVVFNRRDLTTPVQAALDAMLAADRGDTPSWATHDWTASLGGSAWFAPAELHTFPHVQQLEADAFLARVTSISFVARLADDDRARVVAAAERLFATHADDGRIAMHYVAELRLAGRRAAPAGDGLARGGRR
jgi:SAM-dependent methyltransferase